MNKKNIIYIILGALLIVACDPMEKRHELSGPVYNEQQILEYMNVTVEGNYVTLENNAPGTISVWESSYGNKATTNHAKIYVPVKGSYSVTLTAYHDGGFVKATKEFEVAQFDEAYFNHEFWNNLTNGEAGKTWVWASDVPGGKVWGNGGYLGSYAPAWWTLGINDIPGQGGGADDEITFSLSMVNGPRFTVNQTISNAVPGSGSGSFGMNLADANQKKLDNGDLWSYGQIDFIGHTIPLGLEPNTPGKPLHYSFDILKCTPDELVLAFGEPGAKAWDGAWFYVFKRKGYTYPPAK